MQFPADKFSVVYKRPTDLALLSDVPVCCNLLVANIFDEGACSTSAAPAAAPAAAVCAATSSPPAPSLAASCTAHPLAWPTPPPYLPTLQAC